MIKQVPFTRDFGARIMSVYAEPDETFGDGFSSAVRTLVEIDPRRTPPWVAEFQSAAPLHRCLTGIFGTPDPHRLFVVSQGTAFVGDVQLRDFQPVAGSEPVTNVVENAKHALLIFASRWRVSAMDEHGLAWTSDRVSIEDLRLVEIVDGHLHVVADPHDEAHGFRIELSSGRIEILATLKQWTKPTTRWGG